MERRRTDRELHRRKLARFKADMRARGVSHRVVAPMLYDPLWALGLPLRPPLFQGFIPLTLQVGVVAALMFGFGLVLVGWVPVWDARTVLLAGGAVLLAGLFIGLLNAAYIRWTAAQLGLGSWESYPAD